MKVVAALRPGAGLSEPDLIAFLLPRLPAFMVPRFVEFLPELPKTPTGKIRKDILRSQPTNDAVWDREA